MISTAPNSKQVSINTTYVTTIVCWQGRKMTKVINRVLKLWLSRLIICLLKLKWPAFSETIYWESVNHRLWQLLLLLLLLPLLLSPRALLLILVTDITILRMN